MSSLRARNIIIQPVILAMFALPLCGTAYGATITFTQSHWLPGANPFVTPVNPWQSWSYNLSALTVGHPDAEIVSAVLDINAWDFDTAGSVVNSVLGSEDYGFAYYTYYEDDYDYVNHTGTLFDPASLNDVVNVEGNGAHVMNYADGGLVLDLGAGADGTYAYLWDGDLDVSLHFNENAYWDHNAWFTTRPGPYGSTITDWHYDRIASGEQGSFGLGSATLTVEYVVPEPASLSLLGLGLAGLAYRRFRGQRA